jgi:hypothetical protein
MQNPANQLSSHIQIDHILTEVKETPPVETHSEFRLQDVHNRCETLCLSPTSAFGLMLSTHVLYGVTKAFAHDINVTVQQDLIPGCTGEPVPQCIILQKKLQSRS